MFEGVLEVNLIAREAIWIEITNYYLVLKYQKILEVNSMLPVS